MPLLIFVLVVFSNFYTRIATLEGRFNALVYSFANQIPRGEDSYHAYNLSRTLHYTTINYSHWRNEKARNN